MLDVMRSVFVLICFVWTVWTQQPEPEVLFKSAVEAQQRGEMQAAIQDYEKLLKLYPKLVEARANLGAALAHEGRYDEAIAQYKLALVPTDNAAIRLNMAIAYYKKGNLESARREFEEIRKTQPANVQLAILLGDSDVRLGHAADAVAILRPLEPDNAANSDFEYVFGTALIQSGAKSEGADRLDKVAQQTQSADAYLLAGSTLIDLNEFERARNDLEAALGLNPNLPRIYSLVGMARDMNGDATSAEPAFRKALEQDPNDFDANLYLGSILYKHRQMEEAKPYLDRALRLQANSPTARYEMAMWESTSGKYDDAAKDLEALVKSDPKWLDPHVQLANVYYRLHRPADGTRERAIVAQLSAQQQSKGPPKLPPP